MPDHETAPTFDLQSHSTYSDGALPPAEVVDAARDAGVRVLALTDHDTVDGVEEALSAAADVRVIPAVELSSVHGEHEDLHILGYGLDHTDATLLATLADFRQDRIRRIHAMAEKLRALGFTIDPKRLEHDSPGRPHLAKALLEDNDLNLTKDEVFAQYLVPGTPTYVGRSRPTVEQAIEVIHAAGGLAVWAHPYWDVEHAEATLRAFAAAGMDGVEAFYATHTEEQTRRLHVLARELGLITTGSADFHGPAHEHFNRFRAFSLHGLEPDLGRLGLD
ncbi:PHP domain-containing protein [Solirubrobacter sp. CPCC 204708]|uniref:PHP domain-containing protein n=1 Tax=Solirubrobacter deserti TaxID=2282478 RepID=A0ABT4RPV7_9ACTN|nr:PHP domain-containing protein [Solirubrobacter deserti]MBE2317491.1 PHP domain-containing protein [Solirubrobacter deserti]MDA0140331.1 PHP domain-containing protein [Solirubrobacter deserti]